MELSADLFEKMLRQLKGDGAADEVERRSVPRIGIRCRIRLQPVADKQHLGSPLEVWTRDISTEGFGVLSAVRMKPGSHYLLPLSREDETEHERIVLYCTVIDCRELVDGLFGTGLKFTALDRGKPKNDSEPRASGRPIPPLLPKTQTGGAVSDDEARIRNAILN